MISPLASSETTITLGATTKEKESAEMPCLLADALGQELDKGDGGFLRVPTGDMRPNSAPAVIPAPSQLNKSDISGVFADTYLGTGEGRSPSALLSTPIEGSLDFNFPTCEGTEAKESKQNLSFVSSNLEQELRRDAEVRGRSLSPTRSAFDQGFSLTPILEKPECAIPSGRPSGGEKADDLSKLRIQQQQLASQLKFLQEQEWAILDRQTEQQTPPQAPASEPSSVTTPGAPQEPGQGAYLQMGSEGGQSHTTPPTSLHTTPLSAPSDKLPPLLSPSMLDLSKNPAPQGHRLDAFVGHIAAVAKDQHGCRFLQKLCEEGNAREVGIVFEEIIPATQEMVVDPFGNYLMQKLFEYCNDAQRTVLLEQVTAGIPQVSSNMHGTRAVQKIVDQLRNPLHIAIMREALSRHTVAMIKDLNGNHVVQKCLQKFEVRDKQFIYDAVTAKLNEVAMHRHGCCVLQRCIDFGSPEQKMQLVSEVVANALSLVQDPYGNYVVQYVLEMDLEVVTTKLVRNFSGSLSELAINKFSSNVIEKCIKLATPEARAPLFEELTNASTLPRMLQDQFANYVIQTALSHATPQEFNLLSQAIRPFLHIVKNTPHGKRIELKINRKPEPPVSPGLRPRTKPPPPAATAAYPTGASNTIPYHQQQPSWSSWKSGGVQGGGGGWAQQQQRGSRGSQRLRADAPAYAPKKTEMHVGGVPPTAQW